MTDQIPQNFYYSQLYTDDVKRSSQARGLQRFSFECRKTKTKVITLANHKEHRQYSDRSNYR